jgi:hypothetical protein
MPKRCIKKINSGTKKERESYHARFVIKKPSKLNLIKVFVTFYIGVKKCGFPNENRRARSKYRPKLLRNPRKM